jgi:hypothetical protein
MDNITVIAQKLSEVVRQELSEGYSLMEVEQTTRRLVQEIGRQAVARVVATEEEPYPASEVACPVCCGAIPYSAGGRRG